MERICNGVRLFFLEKGRGDLAFLLIPSTGGDHTLFSAQLEFLSQYGRAVVVDPRGHGKSDKPEGKYSIEIFADDFIALCKELSLTCVIVIGSSTGGNIAIELACRYPNMIKGAVMIDSTAFMSAEVRAAIGRYLETVKRGDLSKMLVDISKGSSLPTDRCKDHMRAINKLVPGYVWESVFENLLIWDQTLEERLRLCKTPILYIEASASSKEHSGLADLSKFYAAYPALLTGKVVGSGHYPSLEVPDQVNAMIVRFLQVSNLL